MTDAGLGVPTRVRRSKQVHRGPINKGQGIPPAKQPNTLQTLDRGLHALAIVSQHENGISIADLAMRLGVHRAIGYRLVTTLEAHGLVARGADGQLHLGTGLLTLASRFEPQLRARAWPLLHQLAQDTRAAAFVSVPQGEDCVAIMVAEPEEGVLRIAYRVGSRHPLTLGAAGIAILAGRPARPGEPDAVREARSNGFSVTRSQLQRGAIGVASPVHSAVQGGSQTSLGFEASLGVVALDGLDVARATAAVVACARQLAALISSDCGPALAGEGAATLVQSDGVR